MKNILRLITLVMVCLMVFGSLSVMAITPYSTYTYDIDGEYAASPDAYTPDQIVDSAAMGLDEALPMDSPRDLFVDKNQKVYIADATNNRIVVCNRYLQYTFEISTFTNNQGVPDALTNPQGVFVTEDYIYVDSEEHTWDDGYTRLVRYNIYFFDTQTQVLYYFHNNI